MPSATESPSSARIPAWKRLGLKLKSAQDAPAAPPDAIKSKRKLQDTAETTATSKKSKISSDKGNSPATIPATPKLVRKKSVTFTPETKIEDGDSIKQLFNAWAAEQKDQTLSAPAFQTPQAPVVEESVDAALDEKERRVKRVKTAKQGKNAKDGKSASVSTSPERPFLAYLKQYTDSRDSWKFNKNHQSHLLKHIFNPEVIPSQYAYYIYEYVKGLQGGVRDRLRSTALSLKTQDQEEPFPADMENSEQRRKEYDMAMNEYVATMMAAEVGPDVGYEEGVLLGLSDIAMPTRIAKRKRVEMVLAVLGPGEGEPSAANGNGEKDVVAGDDESQKRVRMNDGSSQKVVRKRKQRTMVVDDESSSDSDSSDSEESSSDESTTARDDPEDTSSSSSSSSSSGSEESDSEDGSEDSSEESDSE